MASIVNYLTAKETIPANSGSIIRGLLKKTININVRSHQPVERLLNVKCNFIIGIHRLTRSGSCKRVIL